MEIQYLLAGTIDTQTLVKACERRRLRTRLQRPYTGGNKDLGSTVRAGDEASDLGEAPTTDGLPVTIKELSGGRLWTAWSYLEMKLFGGYREAVVEVQLAGVLLSKGNVRFAPVREDGLQNEDVRSLTWDAEVWLWIAVEVPLGVMFSKVDFEFVPVREHGLLTEDFRSLIWDAEELLSNMFEVLKNAPSALLVNMLLNETSGAEFGAEMKLLGG